jgi:carboxyl-terminal processing protease
MSPRATLLLAVLCACSAPGERPPESRDGAPVPAPGARRPDDGPDGRPAARTEARTEARTDARPWLEAGRLIVELVRERFFDPARGAAWAEAHAGDAEAAPDAEAFAARMKAALAELGASHTGLFTPLDPEHAGLLAVFGPALGVPASEVDGIGVDLTAEHVVRAVHAGGPAARAGLRRGDLLLAADGAPFHPVLSFRGRAGRMVTLSVQRHAGGGPLDVEVTPRRIAPRDEWLLAQRAGTRIVDRGGRAIGYVPLFSGAGEEFRAELARSLANELRDADALVLDLRNGWGGCNPDVVLLFGAHSVTPRLAPRAAPAGDAASDDAAADTPGDAASAPAGEGEVRWLKPLYVLVNAGTRSGKEVLARTVQRQGLGTLVGERTAGAVLGGSCFLLPDGSLLYLAVSDVEVDGERLEGIGVAPDVSVPDALPFADGADPQLDRALDLAAS